MCKKISIKWVKHLSQNAGNDHFRNSNFQNFWGNMTPNPLDSLRLQRSLVPAFENPGSAPDTSGQV